MEAVVAVGGNVLAAHINETMGRFSEFKRIKSMRSSLIPCLVQLTLVVLSAISNLVRHTMISDCGLPKSAYLTVHTLLAELAYSAIGTCECLFRESLVAPPWLTAVAHAADAFLIALGILLFGAYYGLVHFERSYRTKADMTWLVLNHIVHLPTALIPLAGAFAKPPSLLSVHSAPLSTQTVLAIAYAVAYARHVNALPYPPYAFLRSLDPPRLAFWTAGIVLGVLPLLIMSHFFVAFLATASRYHTRHWKATLTVFLIIDLLDLSAVVMVAMATIRSDRSKADHTKSVPSGSHVGERPRRRSTQLSQITHS